MVRHGSGNESGEPVKLIGLMPVRNEDWVIGLTLRAALDWCDEIVVLDHASTDRTPGIIAEVQKETKRVSCITWEPGMWQEMAQRQAMLDVARDRGATHIAIVDADEILTGDLLVEAADEILAGNLLDMEGTGHSRIRRLIADVGAKIPGLVVQLPWLALPRSIDRYLTTGIWGPGQQVSVAFKDQPAAHWAARNGYDFHHRNPMGLPPLFVAPLLPKHGGLMHLQFLSERRLRAKQALYQITETLRWPGRKTPAELATMYGRAVYESNPSKHASAPCPAEWWAPYADLMQHLHVDAEPWQEAACRRLVSTHGVETFKGLDLFGVV
jgi:hypothetical protein